MNSLTVAPLASGTKYGVDVSTLASGLKISGNNVISGTLNYCNGTLWTEGTWSEDQKTGNFLPMSFEGEGTITAELVGGDLGIPVDCTNDKFCIFRIKNNQQTIKVVSSGGSGRDNTKVYTLTGLTLSQPS